MKNNAMGSVKFVEGQSDRLRKIREDREDGIRSETEAQDVQTTREIERNDEREPKHQV